MEDFGVAVAHGLDRVEVEHGEAGRHGAEEEGSNHKASSARELGGTARGDVVVRNRKHADVVQKREENDQDRLDGTRRDEDQYAEG